MFLFSLFYVIPEWPAAQHRYTVCTTDTLVQSVQTARHGFLVKPTQESNVDDAVDRRTRRWSDSKSVALQPMRKLQSDVVLTSLCECLCRHIF